MHFKVLRLNTSPYSTGILSPLEKKQLENIRVQGHSVEYVESNTIQDDKSLYILISNTQTNPASIPNELLKKTVLMIHPNSGYDNFAPSFVKEAHFPIVLGNEIRKFAVVEFILSALFHHFTALPHHEVWDFDRQFSRPLLQSKKILVMGHGHIGKHLTKQLAQLGIEFYTYDPFVGPKILPQTKMDVVILALSLNDQTKHIINKKFIDQRLVDNFLLINPARGELIDEHDLIEALTKKINASAVLDVFHPEPKDFKHFKKLKNVRLSSHIAGVFQGLNEVMVNFEEKIIRDFLTNIESFFKNHEKDFLQNRYHKGKLL
jgi:D-3-phosphoglycerate dehydrogenase